jgi:CMP-N,N'-diacetyllegionaminic acid synthase
MNKSKRHRVLAIIPARGGSKGIPKKNITSLAGKPLVAWTIEQALKSTYVDMTIVSTEDPEISRISKKYGAQVIDRPKELAKDDSPTFDAILHAINHLRERGESFDIIILLEPTSPLRKEDDIDNAIDLFIRNYEKADSLVSVGEVHLENPWIMKEIRDGYVKPFIEPKNNIYQRQQLPPVYFPYGVVYLSKIEALEKKKTFYQDKTIAYFIERWQNYEIDDSCDLLVTEAIINKFLSQK